MSQRELKNIGIFYRMPIGTPEDKMEFQRQKARQAAEVVEEYYRFHAGNKWDVNVRGFVMQSDCNLHPYDFCYEAAKQHLIDIESDFEPNYWHAVGFENNPSYCGQGLLGGNKSVTYAMHICGIKTIIHELGHNFDLHHSGSRLDGVEKEYGDRSSIMGANQSIHGMTSPHMHHIGFETGRESKTIDKTQQILIAPVELNEAAMFDDEYQNVIIKKAQQLKYYLSMRKVRGTPWPESKQNENVVYVHEWDKRNDTHTKRLLPDLRPGETKILPSGTKVEYLEYSNETARVNIYYDEDDPSPEDLPMPNGFPEPFAHPLLDEGHNGAWYEKRFDGQGFDIHVKGDRCVLYWYTFDSKENLRYYMASGDIEDGQLVADLYTTKGGLLSDPSQAEVVPVGTCRLYFYTKDAGVFNFNTTEHGRGSTQIVPVALTTPATVVGSWYEPDNPKDGISVQQFGETTVVYFYTYSRYESHERDNTQQAWYIGQGPMDNMTLYRADNGKFQMDTDVHLKVVGSANIKIIDQNTVNFSYNIGEYVAIRNFRRLF